MLSGADVVAQGAIHQDAHLGHGLGLQPARSKQPVNRLSPFKQVELAGRISPLVFDCIGEQHWPWRAKCDQTVLIKRQALGLIVELLEFGVEPMRERIVDLLNRFSNLPSARSRAAASGLERN